jgi:hypothetical protein
MTANQGKWKIEQIGESSVRTELTVEFVALTGQVIPAKVTRLFFLQGVDGKPSRGEIVFEVSSEAARLAVEHEWFHLFQAVRRAGADVSPFVGDEPVEIRAALRPDLASQLASSGGDAEQLLNGLLPGEAQGALPLKHSECWLALELKQAVELPEELKDSGALKSGFRTDWLAILGETDEGVADAVGTGATLLSDYVEGFLKLRELSYEKIDERILRLRFNSAAGSWVTLLRLEEDDDLCAIYSVYPDAVPVLKRQELAGFLISENYDLLSGSFEMDEEDGELRFRTTIFSPRQLDADAFGTILAEHIQAMEHYMPAVRALL